MSLSISLICPAAPLGAATGWPKVIPEDVSRVVSDAARNTVMGMTNERYSTQTSLRQPPPRLQFSKRVAVSIHAGFGRWNRDPPRPPQTLNNPSVVYYL